MGLFTVRDLALYMVPPGSSNEVIEHQVLELERHRLPALSLYKDIMALPDHLEKITEELLSVAAHAIVGFSGLPITEERLRLAAKFFLYPNKNKMLGFAIMDATPTEDYLRDLDNEFVNHAELSCLLGVNIIEPAYITPSVERYQQRVLTTGEGTARLALSALLVRHMYEQGILLMYCNRYTGVVGYVLDSKLYEPNNCLQALAVSLILNSCKFSTTYNSNPIRLNSNGEAWVSNCYKAPADILLLAATEHIAELLGVFTAGRYSVVQDYERLLGIIMHDGACTNVNTVKVYGLPKYIAVVCEDYSSAILQVDKSQMRRPALAVRFASGTYLSTWNWGTETARNDESSKLIAVLNEVFAHTTTVDDAVETILKYYMPRP